MSYKIRYTRWKPNWHALTIWECIGELSDQQRAGGPLHPPKAPAEKINHWYHEAVKVANEAIEKMMRGAP